MRRGEKSTAILAFLSFAFRVIPTKAFARQDPFAQQLSMPLEAERTTGAGPLVLATTVRWIKPHRLSSLDRPATSLGLPPQAQSAGFVPTTLVLAFAVDPDTIRVVGPPFALVLLQVSPVRGSPGTKTLKASLLWRHRPALTEIITLRIVPQVPRRLICRRDHIHRPNWRYEPSDSGSFRVIVFLPPCKQLASPDLETSVTGDSNSTECARL